MTIIISSGTIASSLLSNFLNKKIGTFWVVFLSVLLSALSLLGFSWAPYFWVLCLLAVPYGLAAGSIDAALNNYVALHYSSRHMNWLHACWGVGASLSPYIMAAFLKGEFSYHGGFFAVGLIQTLIALVVLSSYRLWVKKADESRKMGERNREGAKGKDKSPKMGEAFKEKRVFLLLLAFFLYCGMESTIGLWSSSFLVFGKGVEKTLAASLASLYYLGIMSGRLLSGFVSERLGDKNLIRLGYGIMILGAVLVILPFETPIVAYVGLVLLGLGSGPIYPGFIHSTPRIFSPRLSQAFIGLEMAFAYVGSSLVPPLLGLVFENVSPLAFPVSVILFAISGFSLVEILNRLLKAKTLPPTGA